MEHMTTTTTHNQVLVESNGLISRSLVLLYGVLSYGVGVTGLMWFILAMGGLAPVGFSTLQTGSVLFAFLVNIGLILLFGLQHSVMARDGFKRSLYKLIPAAAERSTFVLLSGFLLMLAIAAWQPLPGIVWEVDAGMAKVTLWILYSAGWGYLFLATFVTNHFELMGLRQVYLYFVRKPYSSLPFVNKYMYRYSRHPMMLGVLVGMWSVPVMSISHCVMALLLTLYVAVGVFLEERDLVKRFGDAYRAYKKDIAMLVPNLF